MRRPLAGDLVGVRADVEGEQPRARQGAAHRVDRGMRREGLRRGTQRRLEAAAVLGQQCRAPQVGGGRQRGELGERGIEVPAHLMHEVDRRRDVHGIDIDLQQRPVVDPGLVLHLDRVVAETDDEVGRAQELALDLPARSLDASQREAMILVDHALGHGGGGERQVVTLDHPPQQVRIAHAHRARAEHGDRPLGRREDLGRAGEGSVGGGGELARLRRHRHRLAGHGQRHVLRQVEMHRPLRLAQRQLNRIGHRFGDRAGLELQRGFGDRLEQRMVVDPHLDAPAELVLVEVAGDRDQRRAVEVGAADAGREIGRAGPERGDAEPGRAGHAARDVGGEAGGAFVRGEHELDPAFAHRLHQRQHVAARNAETAGNPVRFERCDDQIGVVHGRNCCGACDSASPCAATSVELMPLKATAGYLNRPPARQRRPVVIAGPKKSCRQTAALRCRTAP